VRSDVLDAREGNPVATLVADLADAPAIPDEAFDCIVCTQVLQYVYDLRAAAATLRRILAPGGVLLASVPGISQLSRHDADTYGEYWRFTAQAARRLFGDAFGGAVEVRAAGNVYAATAFLQGLAIEDVEGAKLDVRDPDYELVVLVRAQARA
jgi:SAM-dependent methyltransferase